MWYLLFITSLVCASEIGVVVESQQKLSSSRQELAEIIIDSLYKKEDSACKRNLQPHLEELLKSESEEFCNVLELHANSPNGLTPVVNDHVSEKVLQLFTQTVEIVIEEKEQEIEEKNSRCKRSTVILLSTILGLGTAAATAAITAAITSALD